MHKINGCNPIKFRQMTILYLVRHGETIDNANRIMQGQTQGELNAAGLEQAHRLAAEMSAVHIDAFVSSDLKRAYDTCKIIAALHGKEVGITPLLRERDWGGFTGRYIPDLKNEPWPDDIESVGALRERAAHFIDYVRAGYPGKVVLAVGHGIINKAVQSVFFCKDMKDIPPMRNTEVRKLIL